jgi:hypothetical protein
MRYYLLLIFTIFLITNTSYGQVGSVPEPDFYIKNQLEEMDLSYEITEGGDFKLIINTGDDRSQLVFISSSTLVYRNLKIRQITSPAYSSNTSTLPKSVANKLLTDSGKKKMGSWIRYDGDAYFITRIDSKASIESLKSALMITIDTADEMEQELSGDKDEF